MTDPYMRANTKLVKVFMITFSVFFLMTMIMILIGFLTFYEVVNSRIDKYQKFALEMKAKSVPQITNTGAERNTFYIGEGDIIIDIQMRKKGNGKNKEADKNIKGKNS